MKVNPETDVVTAADTGELPAGSVVVGAVGDLDVGAVPHAYVRRTGGWSRTTELGSRPAPLPGGWRHWIVLHRPVV